LDKVANFNRFNLCSFGSIWLGYWGIFHNHQHRRRGSVGCCLWLWGGIFRYCFSCGLLWASGLLL